MIVCGCDIGSLTAKAVLMRDNVILAAQVMRATSVPEKSAEEIIGRALSSAGLVREDIKLIVGTGYGRERIPFVDDVKSEIACHGKSARWLMPSVRMVIDIGGQDAKAIKVDSNGDIIQYVYNDQCASGTGRFLEVIAAALEIKLEDMGELSLKAKNPVGISNQCVVFAETEVISLVNEGRDIHDIVGGLHRALAGRVASLAKSIVVEKDVTMTGGVAKNVGVFRALEEALELKMLRMEKIDPQINGAVGAALFAQETLKVRMAS